MEEIKINFIKTCYGLLVINAVFWSATALLSFFKTDTGLPVKILLFFEPVLFMAIFFAVMKKIRAIYFLGLAFVFVNSILSVTDDFGALDAVSLILNILLFLNLLIINRRFAKNRP